MLLGFVVEASGCAQPRVTPASAQVEAPVNAGRGVEVLGDDMQPIPIQSLFAETTIIAFWASYCSACASELPAVKGLMDLYRDDPSVAVLLVSADSVEGHDRARALVAEVPELKSYLVTEQRDLFPLMPKRPTGVRVVSLPMSLIIDATGTWHYRYGGGTHEGYIEAHRELVGAAQSGRLVAATDPPPKSVAIEVRPDPDTGGYRLSVVRAPDDNQVVAEELLGVMENMLGYSAEALDEAKPQVERGLQGGQAEFAFGPPESH